MNDEPLSRQNSIRFLYYRFKDSPYYTWTLMGLSLVSGLFLLFTVILPQWSTWFSIRNEVIATQERIAVLNQNTALLNNSDKALLSRQANIATVALPIEKDFGKILRVVNDSSLKSGIAVNDFSFQVGLVATDSAKQVKSLLKTEEFSTVKLTLVVNGTVDHLERFLTLLNERIPLSEIVSVEGDMQETTIALQFYQKQLPQAVIRETDPIQPVTDQERGLLQSLESWQVDDTLPLGNTSFAVPLF
jgi:hypothetical protein